jgi:hypothetical protein
MRPGDGEYPSRPGEPSPWEAKWSLARTRPYSPRGHPVLRGVAVLVVAIGVILAADLVLSGPAFALVAVVAMLVALASLRF